MQIFTGTRSISNQMSHKSMKIYTGTRTILNQIPHRGHEAIHKNTIYIKPICTYEHEDMDGDKINITSNFT